MHQLLANANFKLETAKKKKREMTVMEVYEMRLPFPVLLILKTNDGGIQHAVTVVDDLIFDSTQKHALKLCEDGFKFLCKRNGGLQKFDAIFMFYASVMKKRNGQGKLYYINFNTSYIFVLCQMLLFCEKLVNSSAQSLGCHTVRRWSESGWMGTTKQCQTIYSTLTDIIHF